MLSCTLGYENELYTIHKDIIGHMDMRCDKDEYLNGAYNTFDISANTHMHRRESIPIERELDLFHIYQYTQTFSFMLLKHV